MQKQVIEIQKGGSLVRLVSFVSALVVNHGVRITIEELKSRRSDQQNKYLWVCYEAMLKNPLLANGWTKDDLHEYWLGEFYGWEKLEGLGRPRLKPKRRSSKLNKMEFVEYVDFLQRESAERLGIYLPDPI